MAKKKKAVPRSSAANPQSPVRRQQRIGRMVGGAPNRTEALRRSTAARFSMRAERRGDGARATMWGVLARPDRVNLGMQWPRNLSASGTWG